MDCDRSEPQLNFSFIPDPRVHRISMLENIFIYLLYSNAGCSLINAY